MIDTSFIKETDKDSGSQILSYNKSYEAYYDIKPEKKKDTAELYFTKEQIKDQLKIITSSLKTFKGYFIKNCNTIVKSIHKQVNKLTESDGSKLRIKKQLLIQIFESELSYLKELVKTPKLTLFLRKHIELKLDIYLMAIEFAMPKFTQKG